jgi:hypothetical protein
MPQTPLIVIPQRSGGICFFFLFLCAMLLVPAANAHVGSKDVFQTVHAGPYTLYVTIRPPNVIPGVATVEVRSSGAAINSLSITPLFLTGEASKHPPASDLMKQSAVDPAFFTGGVWMMASGAWQVQLQIDGAAGSQRSSVPVVAVPVSTLKMDRGMGILLTFLGLFLLVGMAGIVAASFRDARLPPGAQPAPELRRNGLIAAAISVVAMIAIVILGGLWWNVEAANYASNIALFSAAATKATLSGNQLDLHVQQVRKASYRYLRSNDDYLPDHGKLMHLYAIRQPGMDAAFHLHPTLVAQGDFRLTLPAMPPGHYNLYGDVVHANGFPETLVTSIDIPANMQGTPLASDDASAHPPAISAGELGPSYKLPDGYTMVWDRPASLTASAAYTFHFRLLSPDGTPATGMEPYLGMAGHAAFIKTDGTVFAHTHPDGSASMADIMLANESMSAAPMADMTPTGPLSPEVDFPYGFPTPGRYRIFIQMKHNGIVETGVFDATVR